MFILIEADMISFWDFGQTSTIWESAPDELGFGMDVPHAVLGESFVDAVKHCAEHTTHQPHQHEEGQVHRRP